MDNKNKYWMGLVGIIGVLFGRILNRVLGDKFGGNGTFIMMASVLTIIFIGIMALIVMKHYIGAVISFVMTLPVIIMGIGVYMSNIDIIGLGLLLLFFIIMPILIKIIPRFKGRI